MRDKRYCGTPDHVLKWKNPQDITAPTQTVDTYIHPQCKATREHDKILQMSASRDTLNKYLQLPTTPEGLYILELELSLDLLLNINQMQQKLISAYIYSHLLLRH